MVVRAGAGYDTIDVAHCASQGIYVTNCPGKNAHAVAELTLGLILAIDRRLAENVQLLKEGKWNKGAYANCAGIKGRTLGVVGLGAIGQLVVQRALAFEMNVIGFSRNMKQGHLAKDLGIEISDDLGYLLSHSDIVTFHVPGGKETVEMINKDLLARMKPDAVLINTSRGSIVNEDHLLAHLEEHKDFWVGTDVFKGEPAGKDGVFDTPWPGTRGSTARTTSARAPSRPRRPSARRPSASSRSSPAPARSTTRTASTRSAIFQSSTR